MHVSRYILYMQHQQLPYWHPFTRVLFRVFGLYFLLYFFTGKFTFLWISLVRLIAPLAGIDQSITITGSGSGDGLFYYLQVPAIFTVALTTGLIWTLFDRKRKSYNEAFYWVWAAIRYAVGFYLVLYGMGKVFQSQFPAPFLHRLIQPYGTSSPMGLAWTFMGASPGFNYFTGGMEALGGLLLIFRPTVKAGAILSCTVLSVIVVMNFCYDIPVKIFSTHLLLGTLFILAPELSRLLKFLFTQKAVGASIMYIPKLEGTASRIAKTASKTVLLLVILVGGINMSGGISKMRERRKNVPLRGLYRVEHVVKNQDTLQLNVLDKVRWRYLAVEFKEAAIVQHFNDSFSRYKIRVDTTTRGITMTDKNKDRRYFHYKQEGHYLIFEERLALDTIRTYMRFKDPDDFLLVNRGFHWVNEVPYNK